MEQKLMHRFSFLGRWLAAEEETVVDYPEPEIVREASQARVDWLAAKCYFNNATDPDLIDHAIYTIEAAERKYIYLLKLAKEQGLEYETLFSEDYFLPELD